MDKPKIRISITQKDRLIKIELIADSEETAIKIFEAIELLGVKLFRDDLKQEWDKNGDT